MVKRVKYTGKDTTVEITPIKKILDEGTMKVAGTNKELRPEKHASDYGQCMRKIWFRILASVLKDTEPEQISPRVHRIFQNGHAVHDRLGRYLHMHQELKFQEEIPIPMDELEVHGRCDGICYLNNQPMVLEFKSINKRSVPSPKPEHKGQITWYMTMWKMRRQEIKEEFGLDEFETLPEEELKQITSKNSRTFDDLNDAEKWMLCTEGEISGEIIYESKQTNQTYHFTQPFDEKLSDGVRLWFEQLDWHINNHEIPHTPFTGTYFPCRWGKGATAGQCPYYETCWGDEGIQNQEQFQK